MEIKPKLRFPSRSYLASQRVSLIDTFPAVNTCNFPYSRRFLFFFNHFNSRRSQMTWDKLKSGNYSEITFICSRPTYFFTSVKCIIMWRAWPCVRPFVIMDYKKNNSDLLLSSGPPCVLLCGLKWAPALLQPEI